MISNTQTLPDNIGKLKAIIFDKEQKEISYQQKEITYRKKENSYQSHIKLLEEQVQYLKNKIFGSKSERFVSTDQMSFFDEAEVIKEIDEKQEELDNDPVAEKPARKKRVRRPLPANLPRVEVIHDLPENEKICACGCTLSKMGEDISEKLKYIPATMEVIQNIRYKYACRSCEGVENEKEGAVKIASLPPQIIEKSIATPSLLSNIFTSKFVDALPFYRQEKMFLRLGIDLNRSSMSNWAIKIADKCTPLLELMQKELLSGTLINIDETGVQVMKEPDRLDTSKSFMWVFRGGVSDNPVLIYKYRETKSGAFLKKYLEGYSGYIQTDGYVGYDYLQQIKGIELVGCFAHARRKFMEVTGSLKKADRKKFTGITSTALSFIKKLYAIEKMAKDKKFSPEELFKLRQKESKPQLLEFKIWLDKVSLQTHPGGLLGKAVSYSLSQWNKLYKYIESGDTGIDNNPAENAIRPFVIGRNYVNLFIMRS